MSACGRCGTENATWPCSQCGYTPAAGSSTSESQRGAPPPLVDPWAPESSRTEPTPSVHPPPAPSAPQESTRTRNLLIGGVAVLALVAGLGWAINASRDQDASTALQTATATVTSSPTATSTSTPTPPTPKPKSARQRRSEALATLTQMVAGDAQQDPVRGQWVAQLASKYEGVRDTRQQATPFTVPQILAEVNGLKRDPTYGAPVRVVMQGDWGGSKARAKPLWVTFADIDAFSRDEVIAWCESHFTQRGKGLLDVCYPRELRLK